MRIRYSVFHYIVVVLFVLVVVGSFIGYVLWSHKNDISEASGGAVVATYSDDKAADMYVEVRKDIERALQTGNQSEVRLVITNMHARLMGIGVGEFDRAQHLARVVGVNKVLQNTSFDASVLETLDELFR